MPMFWSDDTVNPYFPFWPYFGYFDLGPVQIPPLPPRVGLTDRTTGKVWYLGYDSTAQTQQGPGRMVLTDYVPQPDAANFRVYAPWEGPFFWALGTQLRLGVDNGRLVWDTAPSNFAGDHNQVPWARDIQQSSVVFYVQLDSAVTQPYLGAHLSYLQYTVTAPQTNTVDS